MIERHVSVAIRIGRAGLVIAGLALGVVVYRTLLINEPPLSADEAGHALPAARMALALGRGDLRGFLDATRRELVWPFMHPWLITAFFLGFGISARVARLSSLLTFGAALSLLPSLARALCAARAGRRRAGSAFLAARDRVAFGCGAGSRGTVVARVYGDGRVARHAPDSLRPAGRGARRTAEQAGLARRRGSAGGRGVLHEVQLRSPADGRHPPVAGLARAPAGYPAASRCRCRHVLSRSLSGSRRFCRPISAERRSFSASSRTGTKAFAGSRMPSSTPVPSSRPWAGTWGSSRLSRWSCARFGGNAGTQPGRDALRRHHACHAHAAPEQAGALPVPSRASHAGTGGDGAGTSSWLASAPSLVASAHRSSPAVPESPDPTPRGCGGRCSAAGRQADPRPHCRQRTGSAARALPGDDGSTPALRADLGDPRAAKERTGKSISSPSPVSTAGILATAAGIPARGEPTTALRSGRRLETGRYRSVVTLALGERSPFRPEWLAKWDAWGQNYVRAMDEEANRVRPPIGTVLPGERCRGADLPSRGSAQALSLCFELTLDTTGGDLGYSSRA